MKHAFSLLIFLKTAYYTDILCSKQDTYIHHFMWNI